MLPAIDHPVWTQLVTGKKHVQSDKTTINLLIHSNKMSYERDPSPANVKQLASKTRGFFAQYEALFAGDIAKILS